MTSRHLFFRPTELTKLFPRPSKGVEVARPIAVETEMDAPSGQPRTTTEYRWGRRLLLPFRHQMPAVVVEAGTTAFSAASISTSEYPTSSLEAWISSDSSERKLRLAFTRRRRPQVRRRPRRPLRVPSGNADRSPAHRRQRPTSASWSRCQAFKQCHWRRATSKSSPAEATTLWPSRHSTPLGAIYAEI